MRKLILSLLICLISSQLFAQYTYQIQADSVRIYNTCDTAELIIENRTQDTLGFLFNKGMGRTEFRKLRLQTVGNNSIAITGQDTLMLGTIIKTAVDTIYTAGDMLYYRKTDGSVVSVKLDLSAWGDARYDLRSTNYVALSGSRGWKEWPMNKVIGYDAYDVDDMPVLSDQAFYGAGDKKYYNGLVYRNSTSAYDMAINWNGEKSGPNGMFVRIKDDTDTSSGWSAWRELLFKDYADNKYVQRNAMNNRTSGRGWYRIATNGSVLSNAIDGNRAHGRFILTDMTSGLHQTVEFIASVHFNNQPVIKLISNSTFNAFPFSAIRLVRGSTYEGSAIEVLVGRSESLYAKVVMLDNEQVNGWKLVNWEKVTSEEGLNDGLPANMSQINLTLNNGAIEGSTDHNGNYWQFVRGVGLQTNAGFRHRNYLGMVGDYATNSTAKKIIWTVGEGYTGLNTYYGLGYDYGNQVGGNNDHQIVIASAGTIYHRFNMKGGVSLSGNLNVSGSVTATGFTPGSLRSLKEDITLFNEDALSLISQLKIMEFTYKNDEEKNRHVGIVADDTDWHFATKTHDKFDIGSSLGVTMKAIQELMEKIEALNKRIDDLEKSK
jgi:hypothetical protein